MEKSILDELFEAKCDNFEEERMKKEKGCNDKYYSSLEKAEAILELVPETNRKYAKECYEQLVRNFLNHTNELNKEYYKLGIKNGVQIIREIEETTPEQVAEFDQYFKFFDGENTDFNDFIEEYKVRHIYKDSKYAENRAKIKEILDKNPRIRNFVEDDEIVELTKNELEELLKIYRIKEDQNAIETAYIFKLGIREGRF